MDSTTHTLVSLGLLGIAYYTGYRIGGAEAFGAGFREGAESAIDKIMASLKTEFGLNIFYDVKTGEKDEN